MHRRHPSGARTPPLARISSAKNWDVRKKRAGTAPSDLPIVESWTPASSGGHQLNLACISCPRTALIHVPAGPRQARPRLATVAED